MSPGDGTSAAGTDLAPGRLLVATPSLADPNFDHTVVLLLDIDDDGALGVVLNRPSPVPVHEVLSGWDDVLAAPDVLFQGGPVGTDSALAVADLRSLPAAAGDAQEPRGASGVAGAGHGPDPAEPLADLDEGDDGDPVGFRRLFGSTGIVDLDTPTEIMAPALTRLRVYAGYAGWGGGQLELEVAEGSWYVLPAAPGDLFEADPERLWARVLRRQPGELAWVSTRPVDPTQN